MKNFVLALTLLAPLPALAAFSLSWPLACEAGKDCFVQNYVDRDPGPGLQDYTCGSESYENNHDGTDIRLRNLAAMRDGVAVLAAADGTVDKTRDEMADQSIEEVPGHDTQHRDCGNAVIIKHEDGYMTSYCHLKKGSVTVTPGQRVKAGDKIAEVGLSGQTDFPHLHFAVRKDGKVVDPFDGQPQSAPCGRGAGTLWQHPPSYRLAGLLGDGFLDAMPDKRAMRDTPRSLAQLDTHAPMLAYWVDLMNLRKGDLLTIRLLAPNGDVLAENAETINGAQGFAFRFIGKRFHEALPAGTYRAELTLRRDNQTLIQETKTVPAK